MVDDRMKKVLILKNFDSKYIDHAIVFLRNDNKSKNAVERLDQNYLVNEAVKVVNQYVEHNYFTAKQQEKKEKNKKIGKMLNTMIFLAIILLISLLTRAFFI